MSDEHQNLQHVYDHTRDAKEECTRYMYHHVILTTNDGQSFDGIIEKVDDDQVTVLVGEDIMERENDMYERQFYGYGGFPGPRYRRFRRQILPLALLAALSLFPYPRPYPYYPYY